MPELPPIEARLLSILEKCCEFSRPCKACSKPLYFMRHTGTDKPTPYTAEGVNHFIDCPASERFRKQRAMRA